MAAGVPAPPLCPSAFRAEAPIFVPGAEAYPPPTGGDVEELLAALSEGPFDGEGQADECAGAHLDHDDREKVNTWTPDSAPPETQSSDGGDEVAAAIDDGDPDAAPPETQSSEGSDEGAIAAALGARIQMPPRPRRSPRQGVMRWLRPSTAPLWTRRLPGMTWSRPSAAAL